MIECFIKAEEECTKRVDVSPDKVLRPIGTTFKEWTECSNTTDLPHWITWKIKGYIRAYRGRQGDTLLYERMEEIESTGDQMSDKGRQRTKDSRVRFVRRRMDKFRNKNAKRNRKAH